MVTASASPAYREGSSGGHRAPWTRRGHLRTGQAPHVHQRSHTAQGPQPIPRPMPPPPYGDMQRHALVS